MLRRVLFAMFCAVGFFAGARGAWAQESEPVVVRMWQGIGGPIGAAVQAQADRFNAQHPAIRVEVSSHGGYYPTLKAFQAAVLAGDPPEIAVIEVHSVATLAAGGQEAALDALVAGDKQFQPDDLFEPMLFGLRWQDQLYGVPLMRSTPILYFNKRRFKEAGLDPDKPPKTWTEFRAAALKLTPKEQPAEGPASYGFAAQVNSWVFESLVLGGGGELVSKDGKRAEFVVAGGRPLQLWADMIHIDKSAKLAGREAFYTDEAAMLIESTALLSSFEGVRGDEVGAAMLPTMDGQKPGVAMGGGVAVLAPQLSAEKQQAAWKFLAFLVAAEQTADLSRQTGYIPVRKSAAALLKKEGFYERKPGYLTAVEQLAYARPVPTSPAWPQAMARFTPAMQTCLEKNELAAIALTRAAEEVDRILKREATAKRPPK